MRIALSLSMVCIVVAISAARLSGTAGQLPLLVALLTLVPLGVQVWLDARSDDGAGAMPHGYREVLREPLLLLVAVGILGLSVALPLYAGWTWRANRRVAAAAATAVLALLYMLSRVMELYHGVLSWL